MYKAVDRKNKSAGIGCRVGREVYAGRDMWSCNEDIQKCVVCYETTQMQTGTRGIKIGQWEKSLSKLISSKITKTTHHNNSSKLHSLVLPARVTPVGPPPQVTKHQHLIIVSMMLNSQTKAYLTDATVRKYGVFHGKP